MNQFENDIITTDMKSAGIHLLNYYSFTHTHPFSFLDKSTGPIMSFVVLPICSSSTYIIKNSSTKNNKIFLPIPPGWWWTLLRSRTRAGWCSGSGSPPPSARSPPPAKPPSVRTPGGRPPTTIENKIWNHNISSSLNEECPNHSKILDLEGHQA